MTQNCKKYGGLTQMFEKIKYNYFLTYIRNESFILTGNTFQHFMLHSFIHYHLRVFIITCKDNFTKYFVN